MPSTDLKNRLVEARLALEGEERRKKKEAENLLIKDRRREASLAMEDPEREKRREAEEKLKKGAMEEEAKKELARKTAEETLKRSTEEAKKILEEKTKLKEAEEKKREEKIASSQAMIEKLKNSTLTLNPIRTLKTDLSSAVQSEKISLSRIALQTEEKNRLDQLSRKGDARKTTFLIILIILLLASGGGVYFFLYYQPNQITTGDNNFVLTPLVESLIFAEKHEKIAVDQLTSRELKVKIGERTDTPGNIQILDLYFVSGSSRLSFKSWQEKLELDLPPSILAAVEPKFMFGIYRDIASSSPFLILKIKAYEKAFAAMLAWEKQLPRDLGQILGINEPFSGLLDEKFEDFVFKNTDTRLFREEAEVKMIYALLNRELIVITKNEAALGEIINRFRNVRH